MQNQQKILVVDDESDILEFLEYNLKKEGYLVKTAQMPCDIINILEDFLPDLLILDIMMPEIDGVELCRMIRAKPKFNDLLIAFLTARIEDYSQIAALNVGGDDYILKPIRPKVLVTRIKALFRRTVRKVESQNILQIGNITIDQEQFKVMVDNKVVELAKKEFELLSLLASKPGKVFNREEIFSKVWGTSVIVGNRTIDVHVRKIREKLGSKHIKTIKGFGYKLE